jgi:two-component system response regulator (stage 0 sporulation protein A)
MKYGAPALAFLHRLGIQKMYKGCEYIISSINFISENEIYFTPVTKVLYVEIAKKYNTSGICVEKNIRSIIKKIWSNPYNEKLLSEVFGPQNETNAPSNITFLMSLYNYLKQSDANKTSSIKSEDYTFICPQSGKACEFCKEFIIEKLNGN